MNRARLLGYSNAPSSKPLDRDALNEKRKRERQARKRTASEGDPGRGPRSRVPSLRLARLWLDVLRHHQAP